VEITIKYTNIEPSPAIEDYAKKKINSLGKYTKWIEAQKKTPEEVIFAQLEVGKTTRHHQEGKVWYAECQFEVPGKIFRATSTHYRLEAAIDEIREKMEILLREYKEKKETERKGTLGRKE